MNAEDLIVDDHTQGKKIKHVCKVMPDVRVAIFPRALGVKAVRLSNTTSLVISSNKMYAVGVSQFQTNKQRNGLNAEKSTVNVVAFKDRQRPSNESTAFPFFTYRGTSNSYPDRTPQS